MLTSTHCLSTLPTRVPITLKKLFYYILTRKVPTTAWYRESLSCIMTFAKFISDILMKIHNCTETFGFQDPDQLPKTAENTAQNSWKIIIAKTISAYTRGTVSPGRFNVPRFYLFSIKSSQNLYFSIQDPGSRVKKIPDHGSGSWFLPTPDPGVKKAPDPGSGSATLLTSRMLSTVHYLPVVVLRPSLVRVSNLEENNGMNLHTYVHRHFDFHSETTHD